ncbi:MAG TPA: hypothetical protein VFE30_12585 [Anaeromyxobacteraceae bacterium]|jgi:hypothetical protein|nr:hypothetical protein [Anaeromyxobacteraceae bacterium]
MGFLELYTKATELMGKAGSAYDQVAQHVRLEAGRLFLSDAVLEWAVRRGTDASDGQLELLEFRRARDGFHCSLRTPSGTVHGVVTPLSLALEQEHASVKLRTPGAIEVVDRPVATAMATAITWLFGGGATARAAFGTVLPESCQWDGKEVCIRLPLEASLRPNTPVSFTFADGEHGLWVTCSDNAALAPLATRLAAAALQRGLSAWRTSRPE